MAAVRKKTSSAGGGDRAASAVRAVCSRPRATRHRPVVEPQAMRSLPKAASNGSRKARGIGDSASEPVLRMVIFRKRSGSRQRAKVGPRRPRRSSVGHVVEQQTCVREAPQDVRQLVGAGRRYLHADRYAELAGSPPEGVACPGGQPVR